MEEKILLKKAGQGAPEAFEQVYDLYVKKIYRFIYYKLNSKEEAEDLTSEVFCRTWHYIAQGNKIKNLKPFLYKIAYNLVIDFYAQKQKAPLELKEELKETIVDKFSLSDQIEQSFELRHVKKAMKKLPAIYQEILILRYLDDLTISEISQVLKKSKNSVYVLIHRAIKALKKILNE